MGSNCLGATPLITSSDVTWLVRTAKVSRWQEAVIKAESEGEKDKRGEQLLNFWAKLTRRAFFRFRDVRKREGLAEPLVW